MVRFPTPGKPVFHGEADDVKDQRALCMRRKWGMASGKLTLFATGWIVGGEKTNP